MNLKPYLKAAFAGAVAAIAFLAPVVDDGVSASEALLTAGAFLGAAAGVFYIPYESTKPSEDNADGAVDRY